MNAWKVTRIFFGRLKQPLIGSGDENEDEKIKIPPPPEDSDEDDGNRGPEAGTPETGAGDTETDKPEPKLGRQPGAKGVGRTRALTGTELN